MSNPWDFSSPVWYERYECTDYPTFEPCSDPGDTYIISSAQAGCVNVTATFVSSLDHLEGETVAILADGIRLPNQVVTNGSVNLSSAYAEVIVGLPYSSDFCTLNIDLPTKAGTVQGRPLKISNTTFRLLNSRGGYVGPDKDHLYEAFSTDNLSAAKQVGEDIGTGEARLFNRDIRVPLGHEYRRGGRVFVRQVDPLPLTIGQIVPEVTVS
jgi:hypothetical protein